MTSILQYPLLNGCSFTVNNCMCSNVVTSSPVYNWILFGKLGETSYNIPKYKTTFATASGKNRYLTDVIVKAISPSTATVELAVNGIVTLTIPQSAKVESSDTAIATATILNETTTITGVAAGTATVTISDSENNTISTLEITVA